MTSVVVLGSGALARSVCYSLAVADIPLTITIAARNRDAASEIAYIATTRAAISGSPVSARGVGVDLGDVTAVAGVLRSAAPSVALLVASIQSPWERYQAPSAWTSLLDRAGFGLTAPLHAQLATVAATAAADTATRLLVGCYPDAVNPILSGLGLPVFAGIGNVALLGASLRGALGGDRDAPLRVLAHHAHLYPPASPDEEARAWLADTPVPDVTEALAAQRKASRPELNAITGHATAALIADLVGGGVVRANLPGPLGLPGGYPVRVDGPGADPLLDLPAGLTADAAVAWNRAMGRHEGIDIDGRAVRFTDRVRAEVEPHLSTFDGFDVDDLPRTTEALLRLRDTLRADRPC